MTPLNTFEACCALFYNDVTVLRLRRGVVTVDVPLDLLELNQCPQSFGVANAFKNTARCNTVSTKVRISSVTHTRTHHIYISLKNKGSLFYIYWCPQCSTQVGFPFQLGAYRCDCRQGFEYHHLDGKFWIEGFLLESEYKKKVRGLFSRYAEPTARTHTHARRCTQRERKR